ncbi:MAG TPA: hypothetical protein VFL96_10310, partial [Acidobacteriaceae bacterium]|nr:hypothetical protein [Acidobacteriaceae bacterium]
TQLIERQEGRFEPEDSEDRYETRLREVIQAKLKGEGITPPQEEKADRGNVIDLMSALKASLGREEKAAEETPALRRPSQPAQSKAKKTAPKKAASRKRA